MKQLVIDYFISGDLEPGPNKREHACKSDVSSNGEIPYISNRGHNQQPMLN